MILIPCICQNSPVNQFKRKEPTYLKEATDYEMQYIVVIPCENLMNDVIYFVSI
jgi:hypothetical protein